MSGSGSSSSWSQASSKVVLNISAMTLSADTLLSERGDIGEVRCVYRSAAIKSRTIGHAVIVRVPMCAIQVMLEVVSTKGMYGMLLPMKTYLTNFLPSQLYDPPSIHIIIIYPWYTYNIPYHIYRIQNSCDSADFYIFISFFPCGGIKYHLLP